MLSRSGVVALLLLGLLPFPGASAQGLLQNLFGFGPPPPRNIPPPATYRPPPSAGPGYFRDLFEDEAPRAQPTYRTVCVRLCDGYYFPISFATTRQGLDIDAEKCSASCSGEARLFFHVSPGDDIGAARDFMGLQYESLPNAFKYRKTLVEGCQCKPQPWSAEEKQRHQTYAALKRRPVVKKPLDMQPPEEAAGERPLALLRRAAPVAAVAPPDAAEPPPQEDLRAPPAAADVPYPRRRPMRQQAEYGLFGSPKTILFGVPPPPPRRR